MDVPLRNTNLCVSHCVRLPPRRALQSTWELLLRMILDAVTENRGVQVEFYNRFQYTVEVSARPVSFFFLLLSRNAHTQTVRSRGVEELSAGERKEKERHVNSVIMIIISSVVIIMLLISSVCARCCATIST